MIKMYAMEIEVDYLPLEIITPDVPSQQNEDCASHGEKTAKGKPFESELEAYTIEVQTTKT